MLVIISDLHLTDGTTGTTIGNSAFTQFVSRLQEMAVDASWRDNSAEHAQNPKQPKKIYRPIQSLDLLLMGDIFDIIRSTLWTDHGCTIRPWRDPNNPNWEAEMVAKVDEIVDAILIHNRHALETLRILTPPCSEPCEYAPTHYKIGDNEHRINYTYRKPITIPPAGKRGYPDYEAEHLPVLVNIYYMAGNHDWFFVNEGRAFDRIRAKVVETIGLAHPYTDPFPWDVSREKHTPFTQTLLDHKVFARHGDLYDSFNYDEQAGTRTVTSIGDALVIELINRFPREVELQLTQLSEIQPTFVDGLKEIANVRPLEALPAWLNHLLVGFEKHGMEHAISRKVQAIWNDLVDNLLASPYLKAQDTWNPFQAVDSLQLVLQVSKLSIQRAEKWLDRAQFLLDKFEETIDQYTIAATKEEWLQDGRAHYIVYGHTHGQKIVPLDRRIDGDKDARLFYFNSGTWKKLHERIAFVGQNKGLPFVDFSVMSYLAFFKEGERSGRPFETWAGTLANRD